MILHKQQIYICIFEKFLFIEPISLTALKRVL
nr:MAG TPA: hypothetical protein [Caudoviricetes sp.]